MTPSRYYLHGDRHAERPGLFYCRRCDLFKPAEHFADPAHGSAADHFNRLRRGYLVLRRARAERLPIFRPDDAENLFERDVPQGDPSAARRAVARGFAAGLGRRGGGGGSA